ncbi:Os03g0624700, partial [Oryza sativa Japonica Group]
EPVLVHHPAGLGALGRPPAVEHQRLLHAGERAAVEDLLVLAGGLPVAGVRGAVGADPRRVLAVAHAEEVPLLLPHACLACISHPSTLRSCVRTIDQFIHLYVCICSRLTGEVPWLALVEVDVGDGAGGEAEVGDLAGEVVRHQLLVRRVEPEPRRQPL